MKIVKIKLLPINKRRGECMFCRCRFPKYEVKGDDNKKYLACNKCTYLSFIKGEEL